MIFIKRRKQKNRFILVILSMFWLAGCSLIPETDPPAVATPQWRGKQETTQHIDRDWWRHYNTPELNRLIARALKNNHDLRAATHRLTQARATLKGAKAGLLPTARAGASAATRHEISSQTDSLDFVTTPDSLFSTQDALAGIQVAYEADLFGANHAKVKGAKAMAAAQEHDLQALALAVAGDVARHYFSILALREHKRIAEKRLKLVQDKLETVKTRAVTGSKADLDISERQIAVDNQQSELAAIRRRLNQTRNALAVLLGTAPQDFTLETPSLKTVETPKATVLPPSVLLIRRPDIRQAEARLEKAGANIGAARAAFLPRLDLGAGLVTASPVATPASTIGSLAASVSAPIFQAGRLEARLDRVNARQREIMQNYHKRVLVAYREAEDAFAAIEAADTRMARATNALDKARATVEKAETQYELSMIAYPRVLAARTTMLTARETYVDAQLRRLSAGVALYKAMGGGWTTLEKEQRSKGAYK